MSMRKWMAWVALLLMACNGRLTVNGDDGGAGGTAGATAGNPHGGGAGRTPVEIEGGSAGKLERPGMGGGPFPGYGGDGYIPIAGGWSEYAAGAGGAFVPPGPGEIGQNCIPGGLVTEADGSPAKAVIQTLDRCYEGLACNARGKCVPAPDCPSSGLCVLRRAELGGSGAVGGAPGVLVPGGGGPSGGFNGFVGSAGGGPLPPTSPKKGVVALTASESHVYWLEYGTRDALGNYQHDGALLSYSIADGTTTTVVAGLAGPVSLGLTTSHAYVYVDGGPLIGSPIQPQLLRVPLAGGSAQLAQDGAQPGGFTAAGSRAFWSSGEQVYSMLSEANAVPTVFFTVYASWMTTDATDLYYLSDGGLTRVPLTSGAPAAVGVSIAGGGFALHGDSVFSLEAIDAGGLLSRAPKSGGASQRVRALGAGDPSHLKVVGERYFLDAVPQKASQDRYYARHVLSAGFLGTDPPVRLLERPDRQSPIDQLWVGTASALYWSEGQAIYKQPLPTP